MHIRKHQVKFKSISFNPSPETFIDPEFELGSVEPRSINFTASVVVHTPITKVKVDTTWNNDHHDEARNEVGDVEPSKGSDEDEDAANSKVI